MAVGLGVVPKLKPATAGWVGGTAVVAVVVLGTAVVVLGSTTLLPKLKDAFETAVFPIFASFFSSFSAPGEG